MLYRSFLSVIFATNLGLLASAFLGEQHVISFTNKKRPLKSTAASSMDPEKKVNLIRVRECAENFGKCSVEELESLRDSLHQKRVRHMLLANMMGTMEVKDATASLEQRLLEDDLSLQLDLLKHEMPPGKLFLEDETTDQLFADSDDLIPVSTTGLASTWMMLDEGTLEAAVICAALAAIFLVPQFLDV